MEIRFRLAMAASVCLLALLPLVARLAHLQILEHRALETRASGEFSRSAEEACPRAEIIDRHGNVLTQSMPVWTCFIDKAMVRSPERLAGRLSPLVGIPAAEILARIRGVRRFVWLKKRLDFAEAGRIAQARLEGAGLTPGQERFYPNGALARNLLGLVGAGGHGSAGIELFFDQRLSGRPRRFEMIRDGSGKIISQGALEDPAPPEPLRLTIDRNIQYYAEELLREAAERFSAKSGLVAVQDPGNGELLAMAVHPQNPLRNPIVQDSFEPGSTFKVVTAAAALEESLVREEEVFSCENGAYEIAPRIVIHDHEPSGPLTLAGILEKSSNIGIAKVAERVGALRFYRFVRAFGFATKTGIPLPGETLGSLKPLSDLNRVALAAASYGYGLGASPLQILAAYSAIANGGTLWEPRIVRGSQKPLGVRRIASEMTMRRLSAMLEGVVERGTGVAAQIAGYRVAGKTGTTRRLDSATSRYSEAHYNASFVGFLPASKPLWTILVVIEDPQGAYYGAQVAAPLFGKLGRWLLALKGVAPDRPRELGLAAKSEPGPQAASAARRVP